MTIQAFKNDTENIQDRLEKLVPFVNKVDSPTKLLEEIGRRASFYTGQQMVKWLNEVPRFAVVEPGSNSESDLPTG